ncbi:LLM class flavin-dependent oxidoreductase [Roseovarius pelagicus]|uniref:LLM class flavin-dependent oxidoreductase n=1 Tax=Roseovarius pelagicus TaxID=2980108 RepID=A0ABY6D8M3_9RHOB|nr:LLM class flavin-dependent oxidoreductase [Roseovarius pelagicus]UXX81528.1 LLM class flavin-dependent oxidoreductase [Roseovarius pelagicus]
MDFNIHFSMDHHDKAYGGKRIYNDMFRQCILADKLGYASVSVTEHHLLELGANPAPLTSAVKIAAQTKNVEILTGVVVLPLHDMRTYAGEVVLADYFCDGRLVLGVGRGAYAYEMERLGVPMNETLERFDESLNVLQALLSEEEVSWKGNYYNFEPLTIMPRPEKRGGPRMLMSALRPEAIYHSTKRGFNILTTPLHGDVQHFNGQVNAFLRAKDEMGEAGRELKLTAARGAFLVKNDAEKQALLETADNLWQRFDNVFTGPGIVENGLAKALPRKQTLEELAENMIICSTNEMIDRLAPFQELGVDRVSLDISFTQNHAACMEMIQRFAEEVMPHFAKPAGAAPERATGKEPA